MIELSARIKNSTVEVFVVGKWRPIRYYYGKKTIITSPKILAEMQRTIWLNTRKQWPIDEIKFNWK